jgi:chorismate synthase
VAFKPIATVMQENVGMDSRGEEVKIPPKGRHDVCPVPRAVPVVEALSVMVILDFVLLGRAYL